MMLDHLRHTLFPLSAGLLLCACSTDQPAAPQCEMKFDISSVSRAASTTADNITGSPFAVFGDRQAAGTGSTVLPAIVYNNAPVTYINSAWSTQETQYWYNEHIHSFVAVHPASAVSASDADVEYSNSQLSFTYAIPSDLTKTTDILAAAHRRHYTDQRQYDDKGHLTGGNAGVVFLEFGHLMSQINFAIVMSDNTLGADSYLEIKKIVLSGYSTKANFSITPSPLTTAAQTDDRDLAVSAQVGAGNFTYEFPTPIRILNDGSRVNLFPYDDTFIMLPQQFAADAQAQVVFSYTVNSDPTIKEVTLPLANQTWESGKTYTYRFTIGSAGPIFGSTTISDWNALDVGNIDMH